MNQEQLLSKVLFEILNEHEKIPYTQDGLDLILRETVKKLTPLEYEIKIQDISEISREDRNQRNLPKMQIVFKYPLTEKSD